MNNQWVNMGDVSPEHGQLWIKYGGEDYAECVEVLTDNVLNLGSNQYMINRGTIYFNSSTWNNAMQCFDSGIYGPPEYLEVAYMFNAYSGMELDSYDGSEIIQVGKDSDCEDSNPDIVLHGNTSISKYIKDNFLN